MTGRNSLELKAAKWADTQTSNKVRSSNPLRLWKMHKERLIEIVEIVQFGISRITIGRKKKERKS